MEDEVLISIDKKIIAIESPYVLINIERMQATDVLVAVQDKETSYSYGFRLTLTSHDFCTSCDEKHIRKTPTSNLQTIAEVLHQIRGLEKKYPEKIPSEVNLEPIMQIGCTLFADLIEENAN